MADVLIESTANLATETLAERAGPFWTSTTVGYVIFKYAVGDLYYRKTSDGGATWANRVLVVSSNIMSFDCWADWQTPGDSGTKIHIAFIDTDTNDVRYIYLDTSSDTVGGNDIIESCQGVGSFSALGQRWVNYCSITKTRGGNIAVALRYSDGSNSFYSFYTSPDAAAWTLGDDCWEADSNDLIILFPGNETDNQDVWGAFWDATADEISLKTYDDSVDSWSEQLISTGMEEWTAYRQYCGATRVSDNHLILAAWSEYNNAASDLMVWDINGAGSITAKANVITDTAGRVSVSVFINPENDDIYVAYLGNLDGGMTAMYKKSDDGGGTWGGETTIQADAPEDHRWISAGAMYVDWGGKFQPFWFDDDDNDLFTNADNGIRINDIITDGGAKSGISSKLLAENLI